MATTEAAAPAPVLNEFQAWGFYHLGKGTPILAVVGGWAAGKTWLMCAMMHALARNRPTEDGMVVYPRAAQAAKALGAEADKFLAPRGWRFKATFQGQQAPHWLAPNGVRVWVVSYYRPGTVAMAANSLEGINAGWALMDEAPAFTGPEAAEMAWGRVRAGVAPTLIILGRPSFYEWWPKWAQDHGGAYVRVSSRVNKRNIKGWKIWLAGLTRAERDERIDCMPVAVDGTIFADWRPARWPQGNIAPEGWAYHPAMTGYLAVDWGARHPSALIIVRDDVLGADVIVAEINPESVSVHDLAREILEVATPRTNPAPGRFLLDYGVGDKAGKAANDQTLINNFEALSKPATADPQGIGMWLTCNYSADSARVSPRNGVYEMRQLVHHEHHGRRLLMADDAWAASMCADGVSLARAMHKYAYRADSDEPLKNGTEHPIDALRYWVAEYRWPHSDLTFVTPPKRRVESRIKRGAAR